MILQVFKSIGCTLSIADAYTELLSLYSKSNLSNEKGIRFSRRSSKWWYDYIEKWLLY